MLINQILEAYPDRMRFDVNSILDKVDIQSNHFHEYIEEYYIQNGIVKIPYRIYLSSELIDSPNLNDREKRIISSYFTRHNDGYVRQKALNVIVHSDFIYDYEVPFLFRICGEYVVEILEDAFECIKKIDKKSIIQFINGNSKSIQLNEERMISYWSEYYRKKSYGIKYRPEYSNWSDYPACYLIDYLKEYGYVSIRK